jgi:hypothetical protein
VTRKGSATYQPRALQRCPHKKKKKIIDLGTKYVFVIEPGKILQGDVYNIYFSMHGILVNLLIT